MDCELSEPGFKKTRLLRGEIEYQDRIGTELLVRFFRDSNLNYWVELESEDASVGYLDDKRDIVQNAINLTHALVQLFIRRKREQAA
jgi:hypothetical protein